MIPSGLSLQFLESPGVVWIALTIALLVGVVLYYRGGRANRALLALRVLACFLVALLLLDPVLSRLSERSLAPRIALLLDTSLSMSIPDPEEDPSAGEAPPTRAERLAAALRETDLVDRLGREGEVETFRFGADVTPVTPGDADALVPHD
ncbi:MAG: hypothetical protein KC591_10595, partial [Gemmatimonadetes bacterium]|nr:hypothetical protein [Gemmatimonadota bacterium]